MKKAVYIRAWNGDWAKGYAIIDTMMNLSLLYFVSQETGDLSYKNIAIKYADTVLKQFIRSDGSVRHIVVFNTETGEVEDYRVGQGYHIDSSWGRGTAWAFYGLAITYRETKDKKYLQAANQISDIIKAHNSKIFVPYADYLAPNETKKKYDSSAGAITLCGYYLFYQLTKDKTFLDYGNKILNGLTKHCLTDLNDQPLLKHGNVSYHTEKMEESDCSLIYGDYFFMEALRLLNKKVTFF